MIACGFDFHVCLFWSQYCSSTLVRLYHFCFTGAITFSGEDYKLLGVDLSELSELERILEEAGLNNEIPTLFIAEVVLTYMENPRSAVFPSYPVVKGKNKLLSEYITSGSETLKLKPWEFCGIPNSSLHRNYDDVIDILKGRKKRRKISEEQF